MSNLNNTKAANLLNAGMRKIKNNVTEVKCYETINIPLGSKYQIIKQQEIKLENPLIHIESDIDKENYVFTKFKGQLTCNNKLEYTYLIEYLDRVYFIDGTMSWTENGLFHYKLIQAPYGSLLIHDRIQDIDITAIYDYTSLPLLLLTLGARHNINIFPKSMLITNPRLYLNNVKCIFVQIMDSYNLSKGFDRYSQDGNGSGIPRIDKVKFYFNNYSSDEINDFFIQMYDILQESELCVMGTNNIYEIKQLTDENYVSNITGYVEFDLSYVLHRIKPEEEPVLRKYIEKIAMDIKVVKYK